MKDICSGRRGRPLSVAERLVCNHALVGFDLRSNDVRRGGKKEEKEEPAALHFTFVAVQSDTNSHAEALVNHGQGKWEPPLSHRLSRTPNHLVVLLPTQLDRNER
eukprot:scaffold1647_cov148-Skeletonema_menzelii.AAC.10